MSLVQVDHNFIAGCRNAIDDMRRAGMNETIIACVLCDVRAAAIREERQRIEDVMREAPPHHPTHGEMSRKVGEWFKREDKP